MVQYWQGGGVVQAIDINGKTFGRLTVIGRSQNDARGKARWLCKCSCGKTTIVDSGHLRSGRIASCGCLRDEATIRRNTKHGLSHKRLYSIWCGLKSRCYREADQKYADYGGRGIQVCEAWRSDYAIFHDWAMSNGYSESLTIDRINVNGDYEPGNCRWATREIQANNKRSNTVITFNGKSLTISQWAKALGIGYNTICARHQKGWPPERALSQSIGDYLEREKTIQAFKDNRPNRKPIVMADRESSLPLKEFEKIMDAAAWIRENTTYAKADYATINKVCKGKSKSAYGYAWQYK